VTTAPAEPASAGQGLLARHPLVCFFAMAYAFSWLVWAPWVLGEDGAGLLPFKLSDATSGLLNAAAILAGPTLSAFIMTATTEGRAGVRRLLGRYVLWRVGIQWYLFALIGVPLIMLLGTMVYSMDLPNLGALGGPPYLLSYLAFFVLVTVLGGPLRCRSRSRGTAGRSTAGWRARRSPQGVERDGRDADVEQERLDEVLEVHGPPLRCLLGVTIALMVHLT
jgi:hypothetical protein